MVLNSEGNFMQKKTEKWWDKLGKPEYGGEIVVRASRNIENFDPYLSEHVAQIYSGWLERVHSEDWTIDPAEFDYRIVAPPQYLTGLLAERWEFTAPDTYVIHLRKGLRWQNIPPVNGREFTADDVVFHYHRLYGLGSGFTKPAPYHGTVSNFKYLTSVNAADRYTVVFKWKTPNPAFITETLMTNHSPSLAIEAREAVEKWGDVNDWHHAIGTGPFILQDFVSGSSATLVRNPGYWGHDERHPQNKLPYVDTVKFLIIPDESEAMTAFLAGKIDVMDGISPAQAEKIQKTNPEILQVPIPMTGLSIDPRIDRKPFNDIRVRKAMQMAIDLPAIAKTYYGGNIEPYPTSITSKNMKGWGFPYAEWPQDLKDEYAYNPAEAKKLLNDAGYPNGFKTNIVVESGSDLDLLLIVKEYFAKAGIDMEIRVMEAAAWIEFVETDRKHDQLAQRSMGSLGRAHEPLRQLTRFQTGYSTNYFMVSDHVYDAFYTQAQAATTTEGVKKALRDANEYAARQHFAISLLEPMQYSLYQPWLKGFNGQFGSTCGQAGSPQSVSFYMARFWLDRNLKKKMGH
jgi:peptide/nickel transport system substrate-binding protein